MAIEFYIVVKGPHWEDMEFIHGIDNAKEVLVWATLTNKNATNNDEQPLLVVYKLDEDTGRYTIHDVMSLKCEPRFFQFTPGYINSHMDVICKRIYSIVGGSRQKCDVISRSILCR